jgi:carboxymethylenebutenolidase
MEGVMPTDSLDAEVRSLMPPTEFASEIVLYDGMPHGFHADYRPSYRETAAKDGWQRLRTWFQQNGVA